MRRKNAEETHPWCPKCEIGSPSGARLRQVTRAVAGGLALALAGFLTPAAAEAAEAVQDQDEILQTARTFLEERYPAGEEEIEIVVGTLDPRLRLAQCNQPLTAFLPNGERNGGRTTVGVRCSSDKPWTLYIGAEVRRYAEILVARHTLARGEPIRADDLELTRTETSRLGRAYYQEQAEAIGLVAKRTIRQGAVLSPRNLSQPRLVRRGDQVVIVASHDGYEVRVRGEAMEDGTRGERISVRNSASKRVVEGTVTASGVVKINL